MPPSTALAKWASCSRAVWLPCPIKVGLGALSGVLARVVCLEGRAKVAVVSLPREVVAEGAGEARALEMRGRLAKGDEERRRW